MATLRRNSRQRMLVYDAVKASHEHPNAEEVYQVVKQRLPDISLGTVYRNLNQLAQQGELLKICLPGASDRFDARTDAHHHLLCDRCGRLYDIELGDLGGLEARIRGITDFTVTGYQVYITGICQNCAEKH